MNFIPRIINGWKATRQLGIKPVSAYARYQYGLRSGYYRWRTKDQDEYLSCESTSWDVDLNFNLPTREKLTGILTEQDIACLVNEADQIERGWVRLFGGESVPLQFSFGDHLAHWSEYEKGNLSLPGDSDIRIIWEHGRLGWIYLLAQAYMLSENGRYSEIFWRLLEKFFEENPPYRGPQWMSGQEAAIRLIALAFGWRVFGSSECSTSERIAWLSRLIMIHARRIEATLVYAIAQNNNHLLSEAAGLFTAGIALMGHPKGPGWSKKGWDLFIRGLLEQISDDGVYIQQSSNYHRMMLQLVLWVNLIAQQSGREFSEQVVEKIQAAIVWLYHITDRVSGGVPNLGPNDSAYFQPLSVMPQQDFRPVLQTASKVFLGDGLFPKGKWDDLSEWYQTSHRYSLNTHKSKLCERDIGVIRNESEQCWMYLRAVKFNSRPGHADQLHVDLWWRGINIAKDAGSYLYNAQAPWDNALAHTDVHNTLVVNNQDQMKRIGRFLWLDWAQATCLSKAETTNNYYHRLIARHDGYKKLGFIHQRTATISSNGDVVVLDEMIDVDRSAVQPPTCELHWLLPDWPWQVVEDSTGLFALKVESPYGWISLMIQADKQAETGQCECNSTIYRVGRCIHGLGDDHPTWGWVSPIYGFKEPALSVRYCVRGLPAYQLTSTWKFLAVVR